MTPKARRRMVPILVLAASAGVLSAIIFGPQRTAPPIPPAAETAAEKPATDPAPPPTPEPTVAAPPTEAAPIGKVALQLFHDRAAPLPLGSLETPDEVAMRVELSRAGAGVSSIRFSDIFETVDGKFAWSRFRDGKDAVEPPIDDLYLLIEARQLTYATPAGPQTVTPAVLGANMIIVNEVPLHLTAPECWHLTGNGGFEAVVVDDQANPVLRITRRWSIDDRFGLGLEQRLANLSSGPISVQWLQYGPPSLRLDRSRYMDRRRFRFGWELGENRDPAHVAPIQASAEFLYEYADVTKDGDNTLWPTEFTEEEGLALSWFASTNRYFGLTVFPPINDQGQGARLLGTTVSRIGSQIVGEGDEQFILTALYSTPAMIAAGETLSLDMGVYAGPLERRILDNEEPYVSLSMRGLVLYQMSSMCAFCTFQWLADFLAWVLTELVNHVVFDWGLAIILLVLIVRTLLHPITKKSQVNMQKFSKVMQKLKPELDTLRGKYGDDPKRMQKEQMALMQQHGVNPLQMLGCLPMFLQMPIWVALYAALYFSFDLRQQPAFWGVFQEFWGWPFLADLASPDHFFWEAPEPFSFLLWNITGINLLPILMGVIFFFQQKYMTPKTSMSPEQETQQKIMRVMMVVLFPVMLYSAPSGLTLYILTSSSIGIMESRHIRKQVDAMDLDAIPKRSSPVKGGSRGAKDPQSRAYAKMMERRKQKQNRGPTKSFKKRK
ncbi:MAG: YidC/Oxa1 family insertase periplasmic-domain containing protein [Phycisphaerales bacterium]|nr:YidC/Oxa1 family insertase periplasmic-domain containing protein [Phycisphaerales bacterium]